MEVPACCRSVVGKVAALPVAAVEHTVAAVVLPVVLLAVHTDLAAAAVHTEAVVSHTVAAAGQVQHPAAVPVPVPALLCPDGHKAECHRRQSSTCSSPHGCSCRCS